MKISKINPFGIRVKLNRQELNEEVVDELKQLVYSDKLVLIDGLETLSKNELIQFAADFNRDRNRIEEKLLHWDFGPVMEMRPQANPANYLFSHENVPMHWDGAFHREPSILVFNCLKGPQEERGGRTLFSNTENIYERLEGSIIKNWSSVLLTYETQKLAHYGGRITRALVHFHPVTKRPFLRFAEPVKTKLNPVKLTVYGCTKRQALELVQKMKEELYKEENCYAHQWKAGDLVLADNFSLVHGREAINPGDQRHFRRVQIL